MSGLFGSTLIKGTKITDFSGTSAEVGRAIAFGYGAFPVDGFIGWAPLPPVEHRQVKRQGKGGVKQETFTYTLSYAVFFCKGPIYGFKWIKRNGKVVYTTDPSAPLEDREYAAKWAQRVNFHYGYRDQLPDSLIESYEGVGNVSGFPNSCYLTIEDEDVTDNGGAPPNYEACVIIGAARSYTTPPYPIGITDGVSSSSSAGDGYYFSTFRDRLTSFGAAAGGEVRAVVQELAAPLDALSSAGGVANGSVTPVFKSLTVSPDRLTSSGGVADGSIQVVVLKYTNGKPDALTSSGGAGNGEFT